MHLNETIFSLKLSSNENDVVERIVKKTKIEKVEGIAFDPLERTLYWTDATNGVIYQMILNGKQEPLIFVKNLTMPHGIAIDICRRKLYWTSASMKGSSIGRISLDGTNAEEIITGLDMPRGIVVDQFSNRIYWVDDLMGDHFSVESAKLDGTDRKYIVQKMYHVPFGVATDQNNIYWTDIQESAVWKIHKNATEDDLPVRVQNFTTYSSPKGIISRNHFMTSQANNPECKPVIDVINTTIFPLTSTSPTNFDASTELKNQQCLNNGSFDNKTKLCRCQSEYKGVYCEIPICFNYCIEGTCHISSTGNPQCTCRPGFSGERCENDMCNNHCLHGGHCLIENGEPNCQCPDSFYGNRCENMNIKEMCTRFCNKEDIDSRGLDLEIICNK